MATRIETSDCYQSLMSMTEHISIQTIWVPLHKGSKSNEIVNQTAGVTSEHPSTGPAEPSVNQPAASSKMLSSVM
jgi:ribonuclease HI